MVHILLCQVGESCWCFHILRMDVKILHISDFGLSEEPSLCRGRFPNKECHRALKQRGADHMKQKTRARFDGTLNYHRGRGRSKQRCSLFSLVVWGCLFICVVFCPLQNILGSILARCSLLCVFFPPSLSEVPLTSMKPWEGRGAAN